MVRNGQVITSANKHPEATMRWVDWSLPETIYMNEEVTGRYLPLADREPLPNLIFTCKPSSSSGRSLVELYNAAYKAYIGN